ANNERPPFNIRVNTLKISRANLQEALYKKGIKSKEGRYSKDSLIIQNPRDMINMEEYKNGLFTIQDESSSLVAQIMNPLGNSKVIDLCSAPGGKSTHMAQLMNNKGYILSRDIHKHKIDLIKQAAARLGIDIIDAAIGDALKNDNKLINTFDYCLLDAPYSGTGVIRRKP